MNEDVMHGKVGVSVNANFDGVLIQVTDGWQFGPSWFPTRAGLSCDDVDHLIQRLTEERAKITREMKWGAT